jgi:RHS repeat-associated protein
VAANLGTPVHLDELYDYDEVYRLIAADRGNLNGTHDGIVNGTAAFGQDWDLDATGNWTDFDEDTDGDGSNELVQTRDHNEVNETGTIGATTGTNWADPVHDRAGNMTSMPKPSDPANSITAKYDAWHRLIEVSDGGILVARFRYDGEGRRILKIFDTDSPADPDGLDTYEHIFLRGNQVIETREGTGATPAQAETLQPKYQNVWSPRYIDSLILRDENTDQDGVCDDAKVFYLADANYNVTALVDTSGNVVERYVYSPYGEVTVLDADFSADADGVSDYVNTTLYTGREFDVATGVMYYRARCYHAGLGRFLSRDPAVYAAGDISLYRYVDNSALTFVDPEGLFAYASVYACFGVVWRTCSVCAGTCGCNLREPTTAAERVAFMVMVEGALQACCWPVCERAAAGQIAPAGQPGAMTACMQRWLRANPNFGARVSCACT